jgi:hypothetical protein
MSKKVDKKKCVFPVGERYFTTYFNAQIIGRNEEPDEGVPACSLPHFLVHEEKFPLTVLTASESNLSN